jgi:hydroxymethylglutaryl-CoA reductase
MTSTDPARKIFITAYRIFCPIYYREVELGSLVPTLDAMGVNFLNKMMHHSNPAHKITAQEALEH